METRNELANAIFDYIEIFHNRQRRHSGLGWLTRQSSREPTSTYNRCPDSRNRADNNLGQPKRHQTRDGSAFAGGLNRIE
ncbi:IS3 family transposase [Aldersonia sp. NBC_00410]|uniref:IS3 family transposase n=1 Tax=Aldersonia sp. NBC_00410 TaxID=2975954 RepID=UPI0033905682